MLFSVVLVAGALLAADHAGSRGQEIVHEHVKCGEQVVEVGVHEATSVVDVAVATPTFDGLLMSPCTALAAAPNSESLI